MKRALIAGSAVLLVGIVGLLLWSNAYHYDTVHVAALGLSYHVRTNRYTGQVQQLDLARGRWIDADEAAPRGEPWARDIVVLGTVGGLLLILRGIRLRRAERRRP